MTPALLCSYYYLKGFADRADYHFRDWSMDSGAFSAHTIGLSIDLGQYIEDCLRLTAADPTLVEVFALDAIGDYRTTQRNTEAMWSAGVEAIPAYHPGEPLDFLQAIARDYPKIALGGVVGWNVKRKIKWVAHCFAAIWDAPVKVHAFGMAAEDMLMRFPFHSSDASSWVTGPRAWGRWLAYGGKLKGIRTDHDFRQEILWYLRMEHRVQGRWHKEFAKWGWEGPTVRLATDPSASNNRFFADPMFAPDGWLPDDAFSGIDRTTAPSLADAKMKPLTKEDFAAMRERVDGEG